MNEREALHLLRELDLKEYEAIALRTLLEVGRTTAPNLVEATDIPQARIYGVLDALADQGFVKVFPGRPKEYQPKPPAEILERAEANRRREFEAYRDHLDEISEEFLGTFEPMYRQASEDATPTEELFYVVDVGDPSEAETRERYGEAGRELAIITKSFEYFPAVESAFRDASDRDIAIRILFLHPRHLGDENRAVQAERVETITAHFPDVAIRFSEEPLPWRGTLVDPSMDYDTGQAIFLVEEKDIPLRMRQAAVTENGSLVAGMKRYFDLVWTHESVADYPG